MFCFLIVLDVVTSVCRSTMFVPFPCRIALRGLFDGKFGNVGYKQQDPIHIRFSVADSILNIHQINTEFTTDYASEEIGFKNVMEARPFPTPEEDPEFDPDNLKYSCIRFLPSNTINAMGPSWVDPTTGGGYSTGWFRAAPALFSRRRKSAPTPIIFSARAPRSDCRISENLIELVCGLRPAPFYNSNKNSCIFGVLLYQFFG